MRAWPLLVLAACGTPARPPDAGTPDAGPQDAGIPVLASNGPMLVPYLGGPLLHDAWLVTLTYPGVPGAAQLTALGDALPDSGWLRTVAGEYDAGLLGHTHFDVPLPAPATFTYLSQRMMIEGGLDAGWWTVPDAGVAIWLVLYPTSTVPAILPPVPIAQHFMDATGRVQAWVAPQFDAGVALYEELLAHEVVEAMTDPAIGVAPAWRASVTDPVEKAVWETGAELADLCETLAPLQADGFTLPRIWSNAAADAGRNPCNPVPSGTPPYAVVFGPTAPVQLDAGAQLQLVMPALSPEGASSWPLKLTRTGDLSVGLQLDAMIATAGQSVTATVSAGAPGAKGTFFLGSAVDGGEVAWTPLLIWVR
jgi:hypothetical protein